MGGFAAWWSRLSGASRAGLIGATSLVATGAADVLLAVDSHQPWPPAVASILILVPGLYLAWKAVPGPGRVPRGRRAAVWDPADLGLHRVADGGPPPPYIRRPHDDVLDALLDPAVAASRLVVVRGGSSTGKTRAAYEAVARGRTAEWRLEYPLNAAALAELLAAGIGAQTVLWLGELRQYTDGEDAGAAVLGQLDRLLKAQDRLIAVTTMWPGHWASYLDAARAANRPGQDRMGTAGRLLGRLPDLTGSDPAQVDAARGGVVDVPAAFTTRQVIAAVRAGRGLADAADAAARAGQDGQIAQYLAGVPDLLDRFQGPGGNRYGQAVITAAMDASRLGCEGLLPRALLLEAAPGYLTGPERSIDTVWTGSALEWATAELRGAVQAVQPVAPPHGTGIVGYRPADYLDQYGRRTRRHQLGPPELWDALATYATAAADLARLGDAAESYGLYRHAAALRTRAAAQGSPNAAVGLIHVLRQASPGSVSRAAQWTAAHVSLDNPWGVSFLLKALREVGAREAVAALLARDPAAHVSLDNPWGVSFLLEELDEVGAGEAVAALLARDPAAHVSLDNPWGVSFLLKALREVGAREAVAALLARDPAAHVSLDDPDGVASLLGRLREAEAGEAADTLARRAAADANLDSLWGVASLLRRLHEAGAGKAADTLASRAAAHVNLHDSEGIAFLLEGLREVGAREAVAALLARDPAAHVNFHDPEGVASLLGGLRWVGAGEAADTLADRAAAHVSLDNPGGVAFLLEELGEARAGEAVAALLARDPGTHVSLDDPGGVADLLAGLRAAGAGEAADTLANRAAACISLENPRRVADLRVRLRKAGAGKAADTLANRAANAGIRGTHETPWPGREANGTPSQAWTWQE